MCIGIALVLLIHPGDPSLKANRPGPPNRRAMGILDAILDLLRFVAVKLSESTIV